MDKKEIVKHLKKMMEAYGPCERMINGDNCYVCGARNAPYMAIKELHRQLTRKLRRASTAGQRK